MWRVLHFMYLKNTVVLPTSYRNKPFFFLKEYFFLLDHLPVLFYLQVNAPFFLNFLKWAMVKKIHLRCLEHKHWKHLLHEIVIWINRFVGHFCTFPKVHLGNSQKHSGKKSYLSSNAPNNCFAYNHVSNKLCLKELTMLNLKTWQM